MCPRNDPRDGPRERMLDATSAIVEAGDWGALRLARVARAAGVSRQTAYNEFGSKVGLGRALVEREVDAFLGGVQERMERHADDVPEAVRAAVLFALDEAERRPLLKGIFGAGRSRDDELIALATRGRDPMIARVVAAFRGYADTTWPAVPADVKDLLVETLMRVTVSHAVAPLHAPAEVARNLAELTRRLLP
ncbi:TetR family transcriptional regulator [Actinomadura violacea]|uniref:TetR family transcriptional regulator n=1 Tax=Actinomadura violacea TaxID=2819934 RepID=A0ABS3S3Z6_9ACTN|nr:TetR family transcriptional regulator [Actinomadura violacea]MBO2463709.1 TetR family transcriptional regulator [Actinomadura violacea]